MRRVMKGAPKSATHGPIADHAALRLLIVWPAATLQNPDLHSRPIAEMGLFKSGRHLYAMPPLLLFDPSCECLHSNLTVTDHEGVGAEFYVSSLVDRVPHNVCDFSNDFGPIHREIIRSWLK